MPAAAHLFYRTLHHSLGHHDLHHRWDAIAEILLPYSHHLQSERSHPHHGLIDRLAILHLLLHGSHTR
jgi:hypothetical protein